MSGMWFYAVGVFTGIGIALLVDFIMTRGRR